MEKGYQSNNQAGFTLIEVLIALTVFAIGLIALAGMQMTAIRGNSNSQVISARVALADGVIEEFLAMGGDDARLSAGVTDFPWPSATNIAIEGAGVCTARVTVLPDPEIDGVTHTGLTQVQVRVTSQGPGNVTKMVLKRRY